MSRYACIFCSGPSALLTSGSSPKASNILYFARLDVRMLHTLFFLSRSPLCRPSLFSPCEGTSVPSRGCESGQVTMLRNSSRDNGAALVCATFVTMLHTSTTGSTKTLGTLNPRISPLVSASDVQGSAPQKTMSLHGVATEE